MSATKSEINHRQIQKKKEKDKDLQLTLSMTLRRFFCGKQCVSIIKELKFPNDA